MIRVYVAGSSRNWQRARRVIDAIQRLGIDVTLDWPAQIEIDRAHGKSDEDLSPAEAAEIRAACLDGVRRATLVLWLAEGSEGASHETGYAIGRRIPVIVAGANPHPIFGMPSGDDEGVTAWLRTDAKAVEYVATFARHRRCA